MAWVAPPTFANGNTLTATQLNDLSNDCEYLYGVVTANNPPCHSYFGSALTVNSAGNLWYFQYRHQFIVYRCKNRYYGAEDWSIYINGVQTVISNIHKDVEHVYTGSVDISGAGLTLLNYYPIYFTCTSDPLSSGTSLHEVSYVLNKTTNT